MTKKLKKISISIYANELKDIDKAAKIKNLKRSTFMRQCAHKKAQRINREAKVTH